MPFWGRDGHCASYDGAMTADRLYFRQLLAGLDIAEDDPVAQQMVNFVYLVGDRETGEAVAIDPAYDIAGIQQICAEDGMRLRASPNCWPPARCPSTSRPTRPAGSRWPPGWGPTNWSSTTAATW